MTEGRALSMLALDTATLTGWARSYRDGRAQSGTWPLCEGIKGRAAGFLQLHVRLQAEHAADPLDVVAYEVPLKLQVDTVDKLILLLGLVAHVESWCRSRKVRCRPVDQGDWRKSFLPELCGKGTGQKTRDTWKRAAIERARQLGFNPLDDNEADAVGILDHLAHLEGCCPQWRLDNPFTQTV